MGNFFLLASEIFTLGPQELVWAREKGAGFGEGGKSGTCTCRMPRVGYMAFQMDGAPTSEIWRRLLYSTRGVGYPAIHNDQERRAANIH